MTAASWAEATWVIVGGALTLLTVVAAVYWCVQEINARAATPDARDLPPPPPPTTSHSPPRETGRDESR